MGIIRDFLRYEPGPSFNVLCGPKGNIKLINNTNCLCPISEDICGYDLKTFERNLTLNGEESEVTQIAIYNPKKYVAAGTTDGKINIYQDILNDFNSNLSFHGHKSAITALNFDSFGSRLVAGSLDSHITLWDLVSETGILKFKGHKGPITQCLFLQDNLHYDATNSDCPENTIITCSKDGMIKFWNITLQHCFRTVICDGNDISTSNNIECYDILLIPPNLSKFATLADNFNKEDVCPNYRLLSISSDNYIRCWDLSQNPKNNATLYTPVEGGELDYINVDYVGKILRNSKNFGMRFVIDPNHKYIGVHGNDKLLSMYEITPIEKLNKRYRKQTSKLSLTNQSLLETGNAITNNTPDQTVHKPIRQFSDELKWLGQDLHLSQWANENIGQDVSQYEDDLKTIFSQAKIKSCDFIWSNKKEYIEEFNHKNSTEPNFKQQHMAIIDGNNDNELLKSTKSDSSKNKKKKKVKQSMPSSNTFPLEEDNDETKSMNRTKIMVKGQVLKVALMLNNNAIAFLEYQPTNDKIQSENKNVSNFADWKLVGLVHNQGHSSDVRSLALCTDSSLLLSTSADSCKIWNRTTQRCLRTMPCEYGLCCLFLPMDRYCAVGTKTGKIHLYDVQSGDLIENIEAHTGPVWTMALHPNENFLVTGGGDHIVKFWELVFVNDPDYSQTVKRITLKESKTLVLTEEIICLAISPDEKYLTLGMLDNTVKIFFTDTLKFYLSLYGHSLPVTCLSISPDSSLIVTGSGDKLCKIWGLKFGDCHKTLFGHADAITHIAFVPVKRSFGFFNPGLEITDHDNDDEVLERDKCLFFSASKDGTIIQWDAIKFIKIFTLRGHHAEIRAMTISPIVLVSASHDKTIRFWYKGDCIVNPDDETATEAQLESEKLALETMGLNIFPTESNINNEVGLPIAKGLKTLDVTERLMQTLDEYEQTLKNGSSQAICQPTTNQHVSADTLFDGAIMQEIHTYTSIPPNVTEIENNGIPSEDLNNVDEPMLENEQNDGNDEGFIDGPQQSLIEPQTIKDQINNDNTILSTASPQRKTVGEILKEWDQIPRSTGALAKEEKISLQIRTLHECVQSMKYSEMEFASLLLPRSQLYSLIHLLHGYINCHQISLEKNPVIIDGHALEACVKLLCFIFKTQISHPDNIPQIHIPILLDLKEKVAKLISHYRDTIGFNKTILSFISKLPKDEISTNNNKSQMMIQTKQKKKK